MEKIKEEKDMKKILFSLIGLIAITIVFQRTIAKLFDKK